MQKAIVAVSATLLLILGALVLLWPHLRQDVLLIHLVLTIVMCGAGLMGLSRLQDRRLPSPRIGIQTGWGRLHLLSLAGALTCLAIGFALPTRFTAAGMGWSWLTMGFVGHTWLINQVRLERYGVPKGSEPPGKH